MVGQHTPRKSISGRIFAILGVLILVGSMAPVPWLVEEVEAQGGTGDPGLKVTRSDYRTEVGEIWGIEAFAYVVLEDPDRSVPDARGSVPVKAVSLDEDAEEIGNVEFDLLETGIGTGVFVGGFEFNKDSSESPQPHSVFGSIGISEDGSAVQNAVLKVSNGANVVVETIDDVDDVLDTDFTWLDATPVGFKIFRQGSSTNLLAGGGPIEIKSLQDKFIVRVTDPDLNRDPTNKENYPESGAEGNYPSLLRVFSTSDSVGEKIVLTEVTSSDERFDGTVEFENTLTTGNKKVLIQPGDEVFFEYFDLYNPSGEPGTTMFAEGDFDPKIGGVLSVDRKGIGAGETKVFFGDTDIVNKHAFDRAVVTILDAGIENDDVLHRNTANNEDIDLEVKVGDNPILEVAATQREPRSGVYIATLGFNCLEGDIPGVQCIGVEHGDEVSLEYTDSTGESRTDSFEWREADRAIIEFLDGSDDPVLDGLLFGVLDDYTVRVTDHDSTGKGAIAVSIKTTSDSTDGLELDLTETSSNSGVFEGSFRFSTGSPGSNEVLVESEDWVAIEFDDPMVSDGSQQIVRTDYHQWYDSALPNPPSDYDDADDGSLEIVIDAIEFRDTQGNEVKEASGGRTIQLRVETEDAEKDILKVSLKSKACGSNFRVFLTETSENSGIFTGPITFAPGLDCSVANGENAVGHNRIPVFDDISFDPADSEKHLFDLVTTATEIEDSGPVGLRWHPAHNSQLSVLEPAFGEGSFKVELLDRDILTHKASQINETSEQDNRYMLDDPYVQGSERVYVEVMESDSFENGNQVYSVAAEGTAAAEAIAPHLENVLVSCDDVELEASHAVFSPSASCTAVSETGDIEFSLSGCTAGSCDVTFVYRYRADFVDTCSADEYTYKRDGQVIEICDDPEEERIIISYVEGTRTIQGVGPSQEAESATVNFAELRTIDSLEVPVFQGNFSVWFPESSSGQEAIIFYEDPEMMNDGQSGSTNPENFRSVFVRGAWRPSENGEILFRNNEFTGPTQAPVYGPGVPVEVRDADASHPDRFDAIELLAGNSGDNIDFSVLLRETGRNTGVFRGVIPADELALGGTPPTRTIYVEYEDRQGSDGELESITSTVTWRQSATGTLSILEEADGDPLEFDHDFKGTGSGFYIKVKDSDRSHETSLNVQVKSKSDPVGEVIGLARQGSTSTFLSNLVRFETSHNPENGRLFVEDGKEFWVVYEDPLTNIGEKQPINSNDGIDGVTTKWVQARDGFIQFDRDFHIGTDPGTFGPNPGGLNTLSRAFVTIIDQDLGSKGHIDWFTVDTNGDVTASSQTGLLNEKILEVNFLGESGHALSNPITFVETGHNTGRFVAVFSFEDGSCEAGYSCLGVEAGRELQLEATYFDPNPAIGLEERPSTTALWYEDGFGVVRFDRQGYSLERDPVITVYDVNIADEGEPPFTVTVTSEADASGIAVDLTNRTTTDGEPEAGIYTVTISLTQGSSSGKSLKVTEIDTIKVIYGDDEPPGDREDTADVGPEDLDAPRTSLITLINGEPKDPDGENDWFTTQPQAKLESTRSGDIFYHRGGSTTPIPYNGPITLSEGIHEFTFWTVPFVGQTEEPRTATVKVSLNDPTAEIELGEVSELPDGQIELNWEAVSGKTDPLLFGEYKVYRGDEGAAFADTELVSENVSSETFTDRPPSDNPPQLGEKFTYYVRVANEAGRVGPLSDAVDALSDRVAPRVSSFDVDRNTLRENLGEDTVNADLSVEGDQENLDDIDRVFLRVVDPFGNQEAEVNMTGSSTSFSAAYTEFDTCGVYGLFGIASDAVGNEGRLNQSVRFIGLDVDAPQLSGVPTQIQQGQDLNVTVVDNCAGVASIAYSINDGDRREVNVPARQSGDNCTPGPCEVSFQISASRLVPGENRITFELSDANETANFATIRHTVTMIIPDDDDETLDAPSLGDAHSNLVEYGSSFSFTVSGGTPTTIAFEAGDLELDNVIGGLTRSTGRVRVDISDLESGPHTAKVTVTNAFGTDTADFSFYILEEGVPLPPVNVQVSKNDKGQPVISWSPNPDSIVEVGGYLVHRASSPWKVIAVTDADTETYTDTKAKEGQTYRYAVTSYGANGEGRLNEGDDSEESLAWFQGVGATTFQTDEIDGGIPPVVFWVILIVLAVVVVVSLLYVNRRQIFGSKAEEIYAEEYPDEAETPFGEERHMIRCPNCSEDFHVSGERPVVTDCPNCGRKGILR